MKKHFLLIFLLIGFISCQNEVKKQESKEKSTQEASKPSFDKQAYKLKGKEIAMATFKVFKAKIEKLGNAKGLPEVVNFCKQNAQKITDSIGKAKLVSIQRTSHKLRNDKNKPNADQQAVIENYLEMQEKHEDMTPLVMKDDEGFVHFYAPIKLKDKCLKCHGKIGSDINEQVYDIIKKHYPADKATGFSEGELRGIWDIKFLEK